MGNRTQKRFGPHAGRGSLPIDLVGRRFGRLTVTRYAGNSFWFVRCACGERAKKNGNNLRRKITRSCGCLARELTIKRSLKYGPNVRAANNPLYNVWSGMVNRCHNPKSKAYKYYGGRGIRVCARWRKSFLVFMRDVGPRPIKHQLDRKNNGVGYSPRNVRWVTAKENARNTRSNRNLTWRGRTQPVSAWAEELKFKRPMQIFARLNAGWSIDRALSTPIRPMRAF